jgi:hypothetical protein
MYLLDRDLNVLVAALPCHGWDCVILNLEGQGAARVIAALQLLGSTCLQNNSCCTTSSVQAGVEGEALL